MTDATEHRVANPCDCWKMTPWGAWERMSSAPCPHAITVKPAVSTQPTQWGWSGKVWWSGHTNV